MSFHTLWKRRRLTPPGIVTTLGLLGFGLGFFALMIVESTFIPPVFILALISLGIAGLVATGILWLPALAVLYCISTMIAGLFTQQYLPYHLTHPAEVAPFITPLFSYVCGIITICAGLGTLMQNYRATPEQRTSRWLATPLTGAAGFLLGALLVSLLVAGTSAPASGATTVNGVPAVHMGVSSFEQTSVTIPKGSKLLLIDDGQFPHILDNGTWNGSTPHIQAETGAPAVSNVSVNSGSVEIGPFTTAGTFHIFCTVHQGMNLTVIVQ